MLYQDLEIDTTTTELFNTIEELYKVGARNILILEILCKKISNNGIIFNNNIKLKAEKFFNKHIDTNLIINSTTDKIENIIKKCGMYD